MDSIKNQIAAIDPFDPATEPNGEEALHKMLSGSTVYSDTNPLRAVPSLEDRRRRKARIAAGLLLGAAAVTAGVLVASNFGPVSSGPAPAVTVEPATPTASATATPTPTATATTSATTTAAPTQTPTPTTSAVATTAPVVPPVQVPTFKTFTFPDGHISFEYPADWTVRTAQAPYLSEETKAGAVDATILDASGAEIAFVSSGSYGGGTGGWVRRTVYDKAAVPGIIDTSGRSTEFGFASDLILPTPVEGAATPAAPAPDIRPYYFMDVRVAGEFQNGEMGSGARLVRMPNLYMIAGVNFDIDKQPAFAGPAEAKAWMETEQYAQLKALLLSLTYK
ncbi:hypothetical protein ACW4FP_01050 [Paenarthrobacter ureafaciens]